MRSIDNLDSVLCVGNMSFRRTSQIVLAFGLALPVMLSFPVTAPGEGSAYIPHDPIRILSNAEFTPANGVRGGNGTLSDPYIIEGWDINASEVRGITIRDTDAHFVIRDVYIHDGFLGDFPHNEGIQLRDMANGSIVNATLSNNRDNIDVRYCSNILVVGSTFWGNRTVDQVLFAMDGVYMAQSNNVTVTKNRFSAFYQTPIDVVDGSNITITENVIWDSWIGMELLQGVSNATVRDNTLVNNDWGILVTWGANNLSLYHNVLVNNTVQATDALGPENSWDNGYPSGGNYWSDYTGLDNWSGPNQDICPDPDGIGDTPYIIDVDSRDRYPLTSPSAFPPPLPPRILEATLKGHHLENISIAWSISADDGNGLRSVIGYGVYRGMIYNPGGLGYQLIATLPNATDEFTDPLAGEGNPNKYFYKVCAIDGFDNKACGAQQAGKFTKSLLRGPNLVSIPLIQSNESIERVLQTVRYDKAWFYDSSSQEWRWYVTYKDYRRGLWTLNHTMGLWVNISSDCNLTVAGLVPIQTRILLRGGWNMVGFPSFVTPYTVSSLKADVGATRVEGFNPPSVPYCLRVLGDWEAVLAGFGYWVRVETETIWIITIE
ncbi:MAG: nitrous oxide reductase family maturation protein NosD [Thermoplasmata archaeon]